MKQWIAVIVLLASSSPSLAHQTWGDGKSIPPWVIRACCGEAEAHRLRPDQVHRLQDGYLIDGYDREIFDSQVLPSEDGEYWAFYSEYTDADGSKALTSIYCFFVPMAG